MFKRFQNRVQHNVQTMPLTGLPLFPLDIVLFPDEGLPLHVFEERYRQLLKDCLNANVPFGLIRYTNSTFEDVGCTARIKDVVETHTDGSSDIIVVGEERFRLLELQGNRMYRTADVDIVADVPAIVNDEERERLVAQHIKLLELAGRIPSPSSYEDRDRLSYFVGRNAGLSVDQRQMLLEMRNEAQRIHYLVGHLEAFIPAVEEAEDLRRKITSNGHFPDFPLRHDF